MRNDEFLLARKQFSSLLNLNDKEKTEGTSGEIDNKYLIALGYWGNFYYFNLRGDKRNAVIQVYEFTKRYPIEGLMIFPPDFFGKDYYKLIVETAMQLEAFQDRYRELKIDNFFKKAWYYTKRGFVYLSAIAGFGADVFVSILTFSKEDTEFTEMILDIKVKKPTLTDTNELEEEINRLSKQLEDYFAEMVEQCDKRLKVMKQITLDDLLSIRVDKDKGLKNILKRLPEDLDRAAKVNP